LSSSLHTLSLDSIREILLSCALENERVAFHIYDKLRSSRSTNSSTTESSTLNGSSCSFSNHESSMKTSDEYVSPDNSFHPHSPDLINTTNSTNGTFNKLNINGLNFSSGETPINSPALGSRSFHNDLSNSRHLQRSLSGSNNSSKSSVDLMPFLPSWNWSYYYYKESNTGASAKRLVVDEGMSFT
jgi:hypothetical protein